MRVRFGYLAAFLLLLVLEVFIAVFVRDSLIRPFIGDVLVVPLLYCLAVSVVFPLPGGKRWPPRLLPLWLFLFAAGVEVGQYFHIADLLGLRSRVLRVMVGGVFDPLDLLCYALGSGLCALWQWRAAKVASNHRPAGQ